MKLINDLPDDCLRCIFLRVPLSDRIGLHRVCHRWRSLQFSVTSNIKSLTLYIAVTEPDYAKFNFYCRGDNHLYIPYLDRIDKSLDLCKFAQLHTLTFSILTPNIISQLATQLPNIESLQINCRTIELNHINQLLLYWSVRLVKFEFNCWDFECVVDHNVCTDDRRSQQEEHAWICCSDVFAMFDILSAKCPQLQHLTFDFRKDLDYFSDDFSNIGLEIREVDLTCLARVKVFRFNSEDDYKFLLNCLLPHALANDHLRQIVILNYADLDTNYVRYISPYPTLMQKISALHLDESIMVSTLSKWTNLATFTFNTKNLFNFTKVLAKLTNLVHLKLFVDRNSLAMHQRTPSYRFHRLPSVKIIELSAEAPTRLCSKHWSWIFPEVQLIKFRQISWRAGRNYGLSNRVYPVPNEGDDVWQGEELREENEDVNEEDYDEYDKMDYDDDEDEYDEEKIKEKTNKMREQMQPLTHCSSLKLFIISVEYTKDEMFYENNTEFEIDHC